MRISPRKVRTGAVTMPETSGKRRAGKSSTAFRTISEAAAELDLPPHVLRFWEKKFLHIKPVKQNGGRRYYRPEDIELLRGIRELLYTEGYTIRGVQKLLKDDEADVRGRTAAATSLSDEKRETVKNALDELESLRDMLKNSLA